METKYRCSSGLSFHPSSPSRGENPQMTRCRDPGVKQSAQCERDEFWSWPTGSLISSQTAFQDGEPLVWIWTYFNIRFMELTQGCPHSRISHLFSSYRLDSGSRGNSDCCRGWKPNPWWQNSQWSPPLFPGMPSLRFPAGCWTERLRTRNSSFRCRFQLQLSSLTSPCRWPMAQRPWSEDFYVGWSGWAWDAVRIYKFSTRQDVGKKVDSLPLHPPSCILLSFRPLFVSFFFPSNKWMSPRSRPDTLQGDTSRSTSVKKPNFCSRNPSGEKQ